MITNKDLKKCNEQLFSYSAAYQVPFYGREGAVSEMQQLSEKLDKGETIVISQPLGTGKTFLVNYMINNRQLDVPVGSQFLTVKGIAEEPEIMEEFPGDTLVVDEADIKTSAKNLIKGLNNLTAYLEESGRKAILMGDYSLKNKSISGALEHQRPLMNFGDIDRNFLKGMLEQRFKIFLKESVAEDFQIEEIIEPDLLDYLAPDWMKSVNSFRGMLSLLQQIVADENCVRFNSDKAFLTVDMFRSFLSKDTGLILDRNQRIFLEILQEYLKEMYPKGSGITVGFTENELFELAGNTGISMGMQKFMEDILDPFAASNLIVSTGVPEYNNNKFVRRPAPYVPSLRLLLSIS